MKRQVSVSFYILFLTLLGILVFFLLILNTTPPISRDALIHHLAIPKLYIQHGGIYEIPDLVFSYYPMNLDLLYMGALYIGSDILPKYIHMAFGLATAALLYSYLKKRLSTTYASLGALVFLSTPIIVKLSTTVYVDLGLIFFTTAAFFLLFLWIEKNFQWKYLLLAGICCGIGLGTKYNGLLVLFLLTSSIPILYIRHSNKQHKAIIIAILAAFLFLFCALLVASPWLIRNSIWTGNPIYPLYDSLFNPASAAESNTSANDIRGIFATRYVLYGESIWQLLLLPIRIFFEGVDGDPRYFDGRLNPFLLLLPLIAFIYRPFRDKRVRAEKISFLAFCLLYFLLAFNTGALRIRYLAPIIPFLVILAMYGLYNIETFTRQYVTNRKIITMIWLFPICLMLTMNGTYIYQLFQNIAPISYISGRLSRNEYLSQHLPEYKVMQYANSHLPDTVKILCVFIGWRGYYLDVNHIFDHNTNPNGLLSWMKQADIMADNIMQRFEKKGITHLLIRVDLLEQWLQPRRRDQAIWADLKKNHLTLLSSHLNFALYQVIPYGRTTLLSANHNDTVRKIE